MIARSKITIRAGARRVLALLFASFALSGCATHDDHPPLSAFDDDDRFAIYTASIARMKYVGSPPCPENFICLDSVFQLTAQPIERIAGNPTIGRQTYRVIQHTKFRDGTILLVHARQDEKEKWTIFDYTPINLEACLTEGSQKDAAALEKTDSDWFAIADPNNKEVCITRSFRQTPR